LVLQKGEEAFLDATVRRRLFCEGQDRLRLSSLGYTGPVLSPILLPNLLAFAQPEWNDAETLQAALNSVLDAKDEQSTQEAYHRLLYALGNDHAGTYYSVALGIVPTLEQILRIAGPWPRRTALEVLIELYGPFHPEPGQEKFQGEPLEQLVRSAIADLLPLVNTLRDNGGGAAKSANELVTLINELGP